MYFYISRRDLVKKNALEPAAEVAAAAAAVLLLVLCQATATAATKIAGRSVPQPL
jgi:hypothetical protein